MLVLAQKELILKAIIKICIKIHKSAFFFKPVRVKFYQMVLTTRIYCSYNRNRWSWSVLSAANQNTLTDPGQPMYCGLLPENTDHDQMIDFTNKVIFEHVLILNKFYKRSIMKILIVVLMILQYILSLRLSQLIQKFYFLALKTKKKHNACHWRQCSGSSISMSPPSELIIC